MLLLNIQQSHPILLSISTKHILTLIGIVLVNKWVEHIHFFSKGHGSVQEILVGGMHSVVIFCVLPSSCDIQHYVEIQS